MLSPLLARSMLAAPPGAVTLAAVHGTQQNVYIPYAKECTCHGSSAGTCMCFSKHCICNAGAAICEWVEFTLALVLKWCR